VVSLLLCGALSSGADAQAVFKEPRYAKFLAEHHGNTNAVPAWVGEYCSLPVIQHQHGQSSAVRGDGLHTNFFVNNYKRYADAPRQCRNGGICTLYDSKDRFMKSSNRILHVRFPEEVTAREATITTIEEGKVPYVVLDNARHADPVNNISEIKDPLLVTLEIIGLKKQPNAIKHQKQNLHWEIVYDREGGGSLEPFCECPAGFTGLDCSEEEAHLADTGDTHAFTNFIDGLFGLPWWAVGTIAGVVGFIVISSILYCCCLRKKKKVKRMWVVVSTLRV